MIEALRKRKAHPAIIAAAKLFRCSACMESERRKLRPMASEKIYKPGEHLSGDQFEWVHPTEDIRVLGTILVDVGSRTAVVKIQRQGRVIENLGNITGQMAAETLRTQWTKFYGRPVMFHTDPEGCFSSNEFKRKLAAMNIMPAPSIFTIVVKSQHFIETKATHFRFSRLLDYFSYHFVAPLYLQKAEGKRRRVCHF